MVKAWLRGQTSAFSSPRGTWWMAAVGLVAALTPASLGCQPEFDDRASLIGTLRVLGVRSDPAEGAPDTTIQYTALVGDENGTRTDVPIDWAYCTLPKPVSETNDINVACFGTGPFIKPFASMGQSVSANIPLIPDNACNQFGPDIPNIPGQPPGRPADPDSTGGYYQPIRLAVNRGDHYDFTVAETRLVCNLPGATGDVLLSYEKTYRVNENPEITSVVATSASGDIELQTEDMGDSGLVVSPGAAVHLTANWPACPTVPECGNGFCEANEDTMSCAEDCTTPKGCSGTEAYVYFDLATRALVNRREAMRISWFANAGSFADDRTGRTEDEASETSSGNTWTAPSTPRSVVMWVVLRDSRGGIGWKSYKITVQ
jgi:hypothetical protein